MVTETPIDIEQSQIEFLEWTAGDRLRHSRFVHPFVERLIETVRQECLDRTLFWTATDLEGKLLDFQHYYNEHRTHAGHQGHPPVTNGSAGRSRVNVSCYRWQKHCRGLYQTPIAA